MHVYLSSLGEFDNGAYHQDDMEPYLIFLFLLLSFFMCIHMLNMLIALMGESFAKNSEVAEANKRMSQLAFVVDNWWLDPISPEEKQNIVYIVGGFQIVMEDDANQDKFTNLNDKFDKLGSQTNQKIDNVLKAIQSLELQMSIATQAQQKTLGDVTSPKKSLKPAPGIRMEIDNNKA